MAELFTREVAESMHGVLRHLYHRDNAPFMPGYVTASVTGRPWGKEMWPRDTGTLLREFALWGWFNHGGLTCDCLVKLVKKNEQGFYTFPTWFDGAQAKSGHELDGTCAIIIGMALLWRGLPTGSPFRNTIEEFLFSGTSPLNYMHEILKTHPFLPGEGEFGGGSVAGLYYNVVQNHLACYAMLMSARLASALGKAGEAARLLIDAHTLETNIRRYMVSPDGGWLWALDPSTLTMTPALHSPENKNHGGHNGPACMYADARGLTPLQDDPLAAASMVRTFDSIYASPRRQQLFEQYGFWSQFEDAWDGLWLTSAYGQGYALQCMLLFDRLEMADKALRFYAETTFNPPGDGAVLHRESKYHFVERYYLNADGVANPNLDPGCGVLNLVNVTEPVKVARLIMGLDDLSTPGLVNLVPRLPSSISGYTAHDWPISTPAGIVRADIVVERTAHGLRVQLSVHDGRIPRLRVRLGTLDAFNWHEATEVERMAFKGEDKSHM